MSTDRRALILRYLDEQIALCEKATPGPWVARILGAGKRLTVWISGPKASEDDDAIVGWNGFDSSATSRPAQAKNARLMAASRTGYPLALAALRAVVEGIRHQEVEDCWYTCPLALDNAGESLCCDEREVARGGCTCGADARLEEIVTSLGLQEDGE